MQLELFTERDLPPQKLNGLAPKRFSHGDVCSQQERLALEARYAALLEETDEFDRKSVSYQGNKGEIVHGWIRYNLTKIAESPSERQAFLEEMTTFLGCD